MRVSPVQVPKAVVVPRGKIPDCGGDLGNRTPALIRRYQYVRSRCQGTGLMVALSFTRARCSRNVREGNQTHKLLKPRFGALPTELRPHAGAGGGTRTRDPPVKSRLYASDVGVRLISLTLLSITNHLCFVKGFSGNFVQIRVKC